MAPDGVIEKARVRFAPSPTGYLHVGSARTALYNWLVARQGGGAFLLRIEDTDKERNREEWVTGIYDSLTWLGLDWDGDPVRQSQRGELYSAAVDALMAAGLLYWCGCTREEIEARKPKGSPPGYDRHCRDLGLGSGPGRALRFAVPLPGKTVVQDLVRGSVEFDNSSIEDFVVVKSSGGPLFVLANVVDDLDMSITHVIRAEEHLSNTPKAVLLWQALAEARGDQVDLPVFAHLPLLVNEKRQKLSKRRDPVAVEMYREEGYLHEALLNYLCLLGWSAQDGRERLNLNEMVSEFRLSDVNNSPAFFDEVKLAHMNGEYIRAMDSLAFINRAQPWLDHGPWPPEAFDQGVWERMAPLVQERVQTLGEVPRYVDFFFLQEPVIDEESWEKVVLRDPGAEALLRSALNSYGTCEWSSGSIRAATVEVGEEHGRSLRKAQAPIRVAVTGRSVGPPLFESLEVLGRDRTLARIRSAWARVTGHR